MVKVESSKHTDSVDEHKSHISAVVLSVFILASVAEIRCFVHGENSRIMISIYLKTCL